MERFCDELRRERERRKVSIEKVSEETKVSSRHLHALEAGEYGQLPGGVFRKGIVRSYLVAVGLEETPWMERFEAALRETGVTVAESEDWTEFAENIRKARMHGASPTRMRWLGVLAMVLVLSIFGWFVWHSMLHLKLGRPL
jgi:cytoskeleton protein RodZ